MRCRRRCRRLYAAGERGKAPGSRAGRRPRSNTRSASIASIVAPATRLADQEGLGRRRRRPRSSRTRRSPAGEQDAAQLRPRLVAGARCAEAAAERRRGDERREIRRRAGGNGGAATAARRCPSLPASRHVRPAGGDRHRDDDQRRSEVDAEAIWRRCGRRLMASSSPHRRSRESDERRGLAGGGPKR